MKYTVLLLLILLILLFIITSCGKEEIISNEIIKNRTIIKEEEVNRYLVLENKKYFFERRIKNNTIELFLRRMIIIESKKDLNSLIEYIKYGNIYSNLIIDSLDIEIESKIYSNDVLKKFLTIFKGTSLLFNIKYSKVTDFIPLSIDNIKNIYNHKPFIDITIVGNFSKYYPGKENSNKLKEYQIDNIKELIEYKSNWESENIFNIWGLMHLKK